MATLARGVFECRGDVFVLEIGVIPQDIPPAGTSSKHVQNIRHADSEATNCRPAAAGFRVGGDTSSVVFHRVNVALYGLTDDSNTNPSANLSSPLRTSPTLHPPRPVRGAFMRRREAGRGAAPAGPIAIGHSGGIGAPPGATRSPCQELARRSGQAVRIEAGPGAGNRRAWRAGRFPPRSFKRSRTLQDCAQRRAIPSLRGANERQRLAPSVEAPLRLPCQC